MPPGERNGRGKGSASKATGTKGSASGERKLSQADIAQERRDQKAYEDWLERHYRLQGRKDWRQAPTVSSRKQGPPAPGFVRDQNGRVRRDTEAYLKGQRRGAKLPAATPYGRPVEKPAPKPRKKAAPKSSGSIGSKRGADRSELLPPRTPKGSSLIENPKKKPKGPRQYKPSDQGRVYPWSDPTR